MSHAPGELEDSSLRRAVREASEARIAPVAAGIRGDIDDAPPLLAPHGRRHFPAAQELALQVEIHDGIPFFVARLGQSFRADAASCIVDEDVDVSPRLHDFLDHGGDLRAVRHVHPQAQYGGSERADLRLRRGESRGRDVTEDNPRSLSGTGRGNRFPYSQRPARDDRHPLRELHPECPLHDIHQPPLTSMADPET